MANNPRTNLPVTIDTLKFVGEIADWSWTPVAAVRQAQDQTAEPGEGSLNQVGIWKRTRRDFILGAGQEHADEQESSDLRYNTSIGLDPWDDRKLKLLNDTSQRKSTAATSAELVAVDDRIYWNDGGTIRHDTSPDTGGFTSTVTGSGYTSMTHYGDKVYACDGSDIYTITDGSRASFSTYNADMVLYGNGRLVAADANELVEIDSGGTSAAIFTHPNTTFVWRGGVATPQGIYVFGDSGGTTEIYFIGIIDADTSLAAPFTAAPLTPNEQVNVMYHYGGVIVMGTNRGFRLSTATGVGHLTYGPLIEISGGVNDFAGDGEDLWFTWGNYDGVNGGLGRTRLDRFTDTLVPRYATDLMAANTGASLAVTSYGSKRYFVLSGDGLYSEASTKVAQGIYNSGWITYGTPELKGFRSLDLRHGALPAGASIVGKIIEDDATTTTVVTSSTTGALGAVADVSGTIETEAVQVRIEVNRATDTSADVEFRRWTVRSIPMPYRSSQIVLALQLRAETVQRRATVKLDPLTEWNALRTLEKSRSVISVTIGDWTGSAYVDGVGFEEGDLTEWPRDQAWPEGVVRVRLITVESTS